MPHRIKRYQDTLILAAKIATFQEYQQFIMELSIAYNNLREQHTVSLLDESPIYPKP